MQELVYRDYGDFFVAYSSHSKSYLLIEDVFCDFFRLNYVNGLSPAETVETVAAEYSVDKEIVHHDFLRFCSEMEEALLNNTSRSDSGSPSKDTVRQHIFNKMSDLTIPFSATIEITDSCNLNCIHCYRGLPTASYWTESRFLNALNELKDLGTLHLTITGGEPLAHPLFIRFLEITEKLGFVVSIQSNLLLLDDNVISLLKRNVINDVSVSLYSTDEREHDSITQSCGSMLKTKKNIERLIENGIPVSINCPVMTVNKSTMADMRQYAKSLGVDVKFALKIIPSQDKNKDIEVLNVFSKDFILTAMRDPNIELYKNELMNIRVGKPGERYCQTGFRSITFDAQGNMLICNAYRKPCGSLNNTGIEELWNHSPALKCWREQTSLVREKCKKCPAYAYCEPCPAHFYTQSGNETGIDELTCQFGKAFYAADKEFLGKEVK